jgi:hypothetical protein
MSYAINFHVSQSYAPEFKPVPLENMENIDEIPFSPLNNQRVNPATCPGYRSYGRRTRPALLGVLSVA